MHYLALILGVVKLLAALEVEYQVARVLATWCEGMLLPCALRWLVFRDGMGSRTAGPHPVAAEENDAASAPPWGAPRPVVPAGTEEA